MGSCLSKGEPSKADPESSKANGHSQPQAAAAKAPPQASAADSHATAPASASDTDVRPTPAADGPAASAAPPVANGAAPAADAAAGVQALLAAGDAKPGSTAQPSPAPDAREDAAAAADGPDAVSDAQAAVLDGKPCMSSQYGPPRPAFQDERLATVSAIKASAAKQDPNIAKVLDLALSVFGTESAVVTLVEQEDFTVHSAAGKLGGAVGAQLPWLIGMCAYTMTPAHHEVLVVEDMAADARFNFMERGGFERFYAGAPLVAANGHRLGTLCLGGSQPKEIDAHEVGVLCNMAELVVRQLEKAWAAEQLQKAQATNQKLARSASAYERPFLFVEIGDKEGDWSIIFSNLRAGEVAGCSVSVGERKPFWEIVTPAMGSASPWTPFQSAVERGVRFTVTGTLQGGEGDNAAERMWYLHFRPAAKDALDDDAVLVGIPAHVARGNNALGSRFYVVELVEPPMPSAHSDDARSDVRSVLMDTGGSLTALVPATVPACFEGLELGPLLGKGSYGRVYRGTYHGEEVAVKIMDTERVAMNEAGEPLEAVLTGSKRHPNLVTTIAWTVTSPPLPYPGEDAAAEEERLKKLPPGGSQTWLLLEFCDMPCLQDAVERGAFRVKGEDGIARQTSPPDMAAICFSANEVARGMAHLHARNVVHGDLKGGNVMLKSADNDRGFEAKVADFGLARHLGVEERVQSNKYGTVTHCPPELLLEGTVSKAVDAWAFGVIMWEMYHGTRAWAGLTHPQIMHAVGIAGKKLTFDRTDALPAHETYFELAEACMARDPAARPEFSAMHLVLKSSAEAWAKLKLGPNGGAPPKDLTDTECTRCVG